MGLDSEEGLFEDSEVGSSNCNDYKVIVFVKYILQRIFCFRCSVTAKLTDPALLVLSQPKQRIKCITYGDVKFVS